MYINMYNMYKHVKNKILSKEVVRLVKEVWTIISLLKKKEFCCRFVQPLVDVTLWGLCFEQSRCLAKTKVNIHVSHSELSLGIDYIYQM